MVEDNKIKLSKQKKKKMFLFGLVNYVGMSLHWKTSIQN